MKAVLISIKPKWCEFIASGKKTVEVRKTKPKIDVPFKCYIYCTMGKLPKYIYNENLEKESIYAKHPDIINGKVIGEFVCDRIDEIYQCNSGWVEENACISKDEFFDYLGIPRGAHMGYDKKAYAWHISNLVIYDKPKELFEFLNYKKYQVCKERDCFSDNCWICPNNALVVRPPQSWCCVEELKSET